MRQAARAHEGRHSAPDDANCNTNTPRRLRQEALVIDTSGTVLLFHAPFDPPRGPGGRCEVPTEYDPTGLDFDSVQSLLEAGNCAS